MNSTTATLAVSIEDSLKIQTAIARGRITLALRSVQEVGTLNVHEFREDQWDQSRKQKNAEKRQVINNGYARVPGKDGVTRQFILDSDGKWQHESSEEDVY